MLCCHTQRAAPVGTYADLRSSGWSWTRRSRPAARRWKRITASDASETPTTTEPNASATRCQPMVAPTSYSVTSASWNDSRFGAGQVGAAAAQVAQVCR
jgi:hypothetical protein